MSGRLPDARGRIAFIDIGRTIAALLIFYVHVDGFYVREAHGSTLLDRALQSTFAEPFGFEEYDFAAAGLGFFFLASGFVVTPIVLKMGGPRFVLNRLFRLYPLIVVTVLLSAALTASGIRVMLTGSVPDVTVGTVLRNIALINFSTAPYEPLVAVAWSLAIEILFYATLVLVLPVLRRWLWLAIAVQLELVFIAVLLHNQLGESYVYFASQMAYVLVPIMGQIIWTGWTRKIPAWGALAYLGVSWVLYVWADPVATMHMNYGLRTEPVAIAVLAFLVGLGFERHLRQRRFWAEGSERVYSLYLVHGVVAISVMHTLHGTMPVWLVFLVGVLVTLAVVEVSHRLVERPSHNLGRRLSGRPTYGDRRAGGSRNRATGRHSAGEVEPVRPPEPTAPTESRPGASANGTQPESSGTSESPEAARRGHEADSTRG